MNNVILMYNSVHLTQEQIATANFLVIDDKLIKDRFGIYNHQIEWLNKDLKDVLKEVINAYLKELDNGRSTNESARIDFDS